MNILTVENIKKSFNDSEVLKGISLSVRNGEFVSVLGASGCGKTTLLRIIAGLEKCDHGRIVMDGINITNLPAAKRQIGMIFQGYSLFPNMTVEQNIKYALKFKKDTDILKTQEIVKGVMQACELNELRDRYPEQLSGGQQQRTAIARSLVLSPGILLLDEPFSALDAALRQKLRRLLKEFQKKLRIAMIYVTHDQEEAFTLSDRIIVIHEGVVQQDGTPEEIYHHPGNDYVRHFTHEQLRDQYEKICKIVQSPQD